MNHVATLVILLTAVTASADTDVVTSNFFTRDGSVMAQSISVDKLVFDRNHAIAKNLGNRFTHQADNKSSIELHTSIMTKS